MRGRVVKTKTLMTANDEMRDRAAIREKARLALEIAAARGDVEVEVKYQELDDPAVFWAWVARARPAYTYEACAKYSEVLNEKA